MANRNDSRKGRRPRDEIGDQLIAVDGITKIVESGRGMRFAALVAVSNKEDHVGFGTGETQEVLKAIRKAVEVGKRNMISVLAIDTTIPHEVIGHFGPSNILLKSAEASSGIAVGDAVRIAMDMASTADITSKSLGSNTPVNVVRVTIDGLKKLKTRGNVLKLRESAKSLQD